MGPFWAENAYFYCNLTRLGGCGPEMGGFEHWHGKWGFFSNFKPLQAILSFALLEYYRIYIRFTHLVCIVYNMVIIYCLPFCNIYIWRVVNSTYFI